MQIWPAIDIRGGKCVRLVQGDYTKETVYGEDPADMAARWVADGAEQLHLVDLDGARDGVSINREAVAGILQTVDVPCQLGGGIRDEKAIADHLELGIQRLVIGTKAIKDPQWLREMCQKYPDRLVIGIDARNGRVATDGWLNTSDMLATELAQSLAELPIASIIYTDITKDGMMSGPNIPAIKEMADAMEIPVIASGGVTTTDDVGQLAQLGLAGCVIGKSLYEGKLTLSEAMHIASARSGT